MSSLNYLNFPLVLASGFLKDCVFKHAVCFCCLPQVACLVSFGQWGCWYVFVLLEWHVFFISTCFFIMSLYQDCCSVTQWVEGWVLLVFSFHLREWKEKMRGGRNHPPGAGGSPLCSFIKVLSQGSLHLLRAILFPMRYALCSPARDRGLGILGQQVPGVHQLCSYPHSPPPDPVCTLFPAWDREVG